jgi:hypothetical protein
MKSTLRVLSAAFLCVFLTCAAALAQMQSSSTSVTQPAASASPIPSLVSYSGVLKDSSGRPVTSITGVTFLIYKDSQGGAPVWMETQNVAPDKAGRYTVQLGSSSSAGLPSEVFMTGEARWLGVQAAGEAEHPRVLLVAVPYAMKAGDAATIGGLPPSAFVLAAPPSGAASAYAAGAATGSSAMPPTGTDVTGLGTTNYIPLWTSTSNIANSVLFQSGSGSTAKIGIGNATPSATLDVTGGATVRGLLNLPAAATATASAGADSRPFGLVASTYNSGSLTATSQVFHWQAEPSGNNTATPSATLNLLFATAPATAAETGLKINGKGQITFATGQTFPGAAELGAVNTFTGNQTVNGIFSASSNAFGVTGTATTTSGIGVGVAGTAATPSGYGVEGVNTATSGGVGVYGTTAASAGYGVEGVNTSGNGTGVYGTAAHFGVQGIATATSGSTVGVYGSGADGLQGSGTIHGVYAAGTGTSSMGVYGTAPSYGLYGVATNTSGNSFGVYGAGTSNGVYGTASNFGLYGVATATSGNSVGVFGTGIDGLQGSGSAYGVYAAGTGSGSSGVYGTAPHFGVQGIATGSGSTVGVFGAGVDGLQGSGTLHGLYSAGTGAGSYGVYSTTTGTGTAGTYSQYEGASALGSLGPWDLSIDCGGDFCLGVNVLPKAAVWADTNWTGDEGASTGNYVPALLATADANVAAVILNNSNLVPALIAINQGSGGDYTGGTIFSDVLSAIGARGSCSLTGTGDTSCTGTLKSVVATRTGAGARRVETYSVQSAENWFEDAGTGQLVNGTGRVNLESVFGQTVNTGVEYHVFLTPDGDCKGLYVSAKTASGFEVRELGGGASSIAFEYRIMAKRAGYEKVRLTDVTQRFNEQEERAAKMHSARSSSRSSGAPRSIPEMSKPPAPPSSGQHIAPLMLVPPVMPSAAPRQQPLTPKLQSRPPIQAALQPLAAQPN